jgi:hypothetical protein
MVVVIIIAVIVVFIIGKFFIDRDKMLSQQVDSKGGMKEKYKYLIKTLSQNSIPEFCDVQRDHLYFRFPGNTTINYYITEHFSKVEIIWNIQIMGEKMKELKWMFDTTMTQENMLIKMAKDIDNAQNELFGAFRQY